MRVWLDLPDAIVEQLAEKGQDLPRAALEALAIDAYRMDRMTGLSALSALEFPSRYELDAYVPYLDTHVSRCVAVVSSVVPPTT